MFCGYSRRFGGMAGEAVSAGVEWKASSARPRIDRTEMDSPTLALEGAKKAKYANQVCRVTSPETPLLTNAVLLGILVLVR